MKKYTFVSNNSKETTILISGVQNNPSDRIITVKNLGQSFISDNMRIMMTAILMRIMIMVIIMRIMMMVIIMRIRMRWF